MAKVCFLNTALASLAFIQLWELLLWYVNLPN